MNINITEEKQAIIDKLSLVKDRFSKIESEFNINLSSLITKVKKMIENIDNDVFSMAFFGAFSDGKSTILSTLIDKLDIKISPEPTTDKIQAYRYKDYQIIDTPGLFSEEDKHDDLTKKYISEANIIIYTLEPVNPLKDSHLQTVKWILSELKKYDSTIFVINKMDKVADLEDEEDFEENAKIKKEVVSKVISENIENANNNKIVCIAADPSEEGLKFWKDHHNDYKKLSRIEKLESLIDEFKETYKDELSMKAGVSVIRDTVGQTVLELNEIEKFSSQKFKLLENQIDEYNNRIEVLEQNINRSYRNIKQEFITLRENILGKIDSVSATKELAEIIQREFGKDGYILEEKVNLIIQKHTGSLLRESEKILKSLEESTIYHSDIENILLKRSSEIGKSVVKGLLNAPTRKVADAVLKTRNFLKIPFKFKPWGAVKFAKFLKGSLPVAMEVAGFGIEIWAKYKMESKRDKVKSEIENFFEKLIQNTTIENYRENYFPFLGEKQQAVGLLEEANSEIKKKIVHLRNEITSISNEL